MPIDIHTEKLLTFAQATKLPCLAYRRQGKKISISTLWRWTKIGVRGVKLETVKAGGSRLTTAKAIEEFFEAVTAAHLEQYQEKTAQPSPKLTATRRKQIAAAERRLAKAGI